MIEERDRILSRIRAGLAGPGGPVAENKTSLPESAIRRAAREAALSREELIGDFKLRWEGLGGTCRTAGDSDDLAIALREVLEEFSGRAVAVAATVSRLAPELEGLLHELEIEPLAARPDQAEPAAAGLTTAMAAVAYSGSLVVDGSEPGELTASLLPLVHIALIPADRIVFSIQEAVQFVDRAGMPRAAVFITGPSRTADIELTLVRGVHGPGVTHAIILDYETDSRT